MSPPRQECRTGRGIVHGLEAGYEVSLLKQLQNVWDMFIKYRINGWNVGIFQARRDDFLQAVVIRSEHQQYKPIDPLDGNRYCGLFGRKSLAESLIHSNKLIPSRCHPQAHANWNKFGYVSRISLSSKYHPVKCRIVHRESPGQVNFRALIRLLAMVRKKIDGKEGR